MGDRYGLEIRVTKEPPSLSYARLNVRTASHIQIFILDPRIPFLRNPARTPDPGYGNDDVAPVTLSYL